MSIVTVYGCIFELDNSHAWMFQAHASMHQDDCPPVVLCGNSQNIATMPYFLLGILRWWSQPQAASFKRLCCWVVKLQSVANIEEFPEMCKILPEVWSITAKFAWAWSSNDPPKQAQVKYKRKHLFFQASNFSHPIFTFLRCHMDQASRIRWAFQLGRMCEVKALSRQLSRFFFLLPKTSLDRCYWNDYWWRGTTWGAGSPANDLNETIWLRHPFFHDMHRSEKKNISDTVLHYLHR